MIKQPNKEHSAYWAGAKYKTEIRPNLWEALYLNHLMPMTISPKAMRCGHNLKASLAVEYYTHSQSTAKKRRSNVSLEHDQESLETRTVSVSQDWLEAGTVSEIMEALHNWEDVYGCSMGLEQPTHSPGYS